MPIPLIVDLHQFFGSARGAGREDSRACSGAADSIVNRWACFRLTVAQRLARLLAATLFPPKCCLCGFPGASLDLDLCCFCHADLPWLNERFFELWSRCDSRLLPTT